MLTPQPWLGAERDDRRPHAVLDQPQNRRAGLHFERDIELHALPRRDLLNHLAHAVWYFLEDKWMFPDVLEVENILVGDSAGGCGCQTDGFGFDLFEHEVRCWFDVIGQRNIEISAFDGGD